MRRLALVVAAACGHAPSTPTPPPMPVDAAPPATNAGFRVEVFVRPNPITSANRASVSVGATITNISTSPLAEPDLGTSVMRVDGKPADAWSMAVNNSGHARRVGGLPPGESTSSEYGLADELFPTPGDYTVELEVDGVAATPVRVHVE